MKKGNGLLIEENDLTMSKENDLMIKSHHTLTTGIQ